jgi:hypothetical protein
VRLEDSAPGDSAHWFLERWEERPTITVAGSNLKAVTEPSQNITWGHLKWLYLGSPGVHFRISRRP